MLVTFGFVAAFAVVSVPLSLGGARVTRTIPWVGLELGLALVGVGLAVASGRRIPFATTPRGTVSRRRHPLAIVGFGVAYAVCSLGCTLPVFLAVIGASLATATPLDAAVVFAGYGVGMATVLMALSIAAALLRDGLARKLKHVLPHVHRLAGALLLIAGAYLAYYWGQVIWADADSLANDPLVGALTRVTAWVQATAGGSEGRAVVLGAGVLVALALAWALWHAGAGGAGRAAVSDRAPESTPKGTA